MALDFTNTSQSFVDHGDVFPDAASYVLIVRPTNITSQNRRLVWRALDPTLPQAAIQLAIGDLAGGTTGQLSFFRGRATTSSDATAVNGTIAINTWTFVCMLDSNGAAPQIYRGTLTGAITEASYIASPATASGAPLASTDTYRVGSRIVSGTECLSQIHAHWVFNRRISLAEMYQLRGQPSVVLPGCVLRAIYWNTTTLRDLSGSGHNGSLTNSPSVVAGPQSLSPFAPWQPEDDAYVVAGGHPAMRRWGAVPFLGGQGIGAATVRRGV